MAGYDEFPVNEAHVQEVLKDESIDRVDLVRLVDEIRDTTIQQRHLDCCAEAGCPDNSCVKILGTVAKGTTGDKLVKHLTSGAVDKVLDNSALEK